MGRLFIGPREIDLVNDLTKELIKDVIGQKIYYYSISQAKTKINELYDEAPEKIFETPLEIDCLINYLEPTFKTNIYGPEKTQNIEVYVQKRDLIDKTIEIEVGDFFTYGEVIFESFTPETIFYVLPVFEDILRAGQMDVSHRVRRSNFSYKVIGTKIRIFPTPTGDQTTWDRDWETGST